MEKYVCIHGHFYQPLRIELDDAVLEFTLRKTLQEPPQFVYE